MRQISRAPTSKVTLPEKCRSGVLVKDFDGELPFVATPNVVFQERMFYPGSELTNNPDNFAAVAHKNTYDTPVWWTTRTTAAENHNGNAL